jgi:hypothetical protein
MRPGTFLAVCDWCHGEGELWPSRFCHKCRGTGLITCAGERSGDEARRKQPTGADIVTFCAFAVGVTAAMCWLLIWASAR